ncbi:hypothetical protein [uncultured Bifidobacterium sp.]|uniref:hypothetical protein n=1 Tax=uncultured Bifidobacterium sp. TaxID=165187 RepID=UPI0025920D39|nr:hypothetical protein [uncultured Bifidobacterium sp.]
MSIDVNMLTGVLGIGVVSSTIMRYYRRWTDPSAGIRELDELIEDAEKELADSGRGKLLPAFVQALKNERDERQAYYVAYKRLIGDAKAVGVPGVIVQSLICIAFVGMLLPAIVIVELNVICDIGDPSKAFPILFAGLFLGLAVLLLCVPVSKGRRISDIFDHYASTVKRRQRECGADPAAWDENDIESIVKTARETKGWYENSRWLLGVTISVMTGVVVFHECGVYEPFVAMCVVLVDSIAFLAALGLCAYSCPGSHRGKAKVTDCGQGGQGMKSSKESGTSSRGAGAAGANEAGNGES